MEFPSTPTPGDIYSIGNKSWRWNGFAWDSVIVNLEVAGNLTVDGNMTVSGGVTSTFSETVLIEDNFITLNSNVTGGSPSENAGIEISRGASANVQIRWNESTDNWQFTNNGIKYFNILALEGSKTFLPVRDEQITSNPLSLGTGNLEGITLASMNVFYNTFADPSTTNVLINGDRWFDNFNKIVYTWVTEPGDIENPIIGYWISDKGVTGATGATGPPGAIPTDYVISVDGATGAITSIAVTGSNTFTGLQTMNAGVTASHLHVSGGATFAGQIRAVGATFTGTVEVDTGLILPNGQTITSAVTTFNGASGAITFYPSLASTSATGVASFSSGNFDVSGAGAVTIKAGGVTNGSLANSSVTVTAGVGLAGGGAVALGSSVTLNNVGVTSFNGSTGAITYYPPTATTSLTGLASFNAFDFNVSEGAVSLIGDIARKASDNSFSVRQTFSSGITAATLFVSSGATFNGNISAPNVVNSVNSFVGNVSITGTANQVSVSNGANTVTVGLPTNVTIDGNLTVNGTVVTANVDTFIVEDPLFMLGTGNSADSVDLGFYAQYTSGGRRFTGLFRDANDGKYRLFSGLSGNSEPTTTVNISGTGFAITTLIANIDGGTF